MEIQIKKFRQLSLDELYEILKLRVDVFVVEQKCAYPELDNKDQHANHLIVSNGNQVVGYLRIYYPDPTRAAIGRVLTLESFRGQGLSRKMMEEALSFLQDKSKIETIYLQAQEHLSNFYASFGFEKTSDVYLDDGIPHVDMEKIVKTEE
ncbi:MAG: GNAT family N-acetyltransferase [Reichenbachiella sp.]|uniref:GNAT family N-acetyltransferase n=1 Tax=Reichenbachiella sp. TaxID=2184521 RepID=UPI0032667ED8